MCSQKGMDSSNLKVMHSAVGSNAEMSKLDALHTDSVHSALCTFHTTVGVVRISVSEFSSQSFQTLNGSGGGWEKLPCLTEGSCLDFHRAGSVSVW